MTFPPREAPSPRHPPRSTAASRCRSVTTLRRRLAVFAAAAVLGAGVLLPSQRFAAAQPASTPSPADRSKLPLADPVLANDVDISAMRASSWLEGSSRWVSLEKDVVIAAGTYGFRADRAMVRIDTENQPGRKISHFLIWLDNARPLKGRGPVQAEGPRLLVTVSTTGSLSLSTNLLRQDQPAGSEFLGEARTRFDHYLQRLTAPSAAAPTPGPIFGPEADARRKERRAEISKNILEQSKATIAQQGVTIPPAPTPRPAEPATKPSTVAVAPSTQPSTQPRTAAARRAKDESNKILPVSGAVTFTADRYVFQEGDKDKGESVLILIGHVRVVYQSFEANKPGATLTADNAVIFLDAGGMKDIGARKAAAGDVRGIYLEDNVIATYDKFTVRAPRVYYDLALNKAIVLDAVMYAWDIKRNIPIYVRADKLRQEAADTWVADRATLTTSEFAEPHFSIAARTLTVRQEEAAVAEGGPGGGNGPGGAGAARGFGAGSYQTFTGEGVQMRVGKTPIFAWPEAGGDTAETPLRDIIVNYSGNDGPIIRTEWDLFSLAGQKKPEGVDLTGNFDVQGKHGPAVGVLLDYDRPKSFGFLDAYLVAYDTAKDSIADRNDIEHDGDTRGFALWRHRQILSANWEVSLEAAYVSDETFLEKFFPRQADEAKPYETSLYVKKQENDWAFTLLTRYDINNFLPQTTTLQSPGYSVDKLPELGYYRVGTSLWGDRLTYYTENRLSRMRIRGGHDSPSDRGFTEAQSQLLFDLPANANFDQSLEDANLPDMFVNRLDSRHEVQAPFKLGIVDVAPYVAGRVTGYDEDFAEFPGPGQTADNFRLWGSTGVRLHTQFNKTYDDAESPLLDVHRLRHIIEPNADFFTSAATEDSEHYPVFDPDVEGIREGSGFRAGVRNTLETQRGGPGRWRNVEWLVVNTDFVHVSDDTNREDPFARFFEYRPEYSLGGDHFVSDVMWMVSDTLALSGDATYDFESRQVSQWRVGATLQHSPVLSSFIDYTELDPLSARLLSYGFNYKLSVKYTLGFKHTLDLGEGKSRDIDVTLTRRLPRWRLITTVKYDQIEDDIVAGVILLPEGIRSSHLRDPFRASKLLQD